MKAESLICRGDRELRDELLADPLIRRIVARLEADPELAPSGVRRTLLATALRLTESMMPKLHATVQRCRAELSIDIPLEMYVYPSSSFNAACIKPEDGRLFIMISSSLIEAFSDPELRFVVGHELGHHLFGHHDVPVGFVLQGEDKPSPQLALKLFAWSRYAEISSDRAGAACADDPDAVARALFRLASGLRSDLDGIHIDDFAAQIDDLELETDEPGKGAPMQDWFSTHPFSPLRLKALRLFFESELATEGGGSVDELEAGVQTLMALMEPSYLEEKSDTAETMRRLLFAGAITVANAHGGISDAEVAAFETFFGEGSFTEKLDVDAIEKSLPARVADARDHVPTLRRIQVLRDLCVIALAEGTPAHPEERKVLEEIADQADIPSIVIDQALSAPTGLD